MTCTFLTLSLFISAGGSYEHAALQPAVSARKLPDEILFLPRAVLASGNSRCSFHCFFCFCQHKWSYHQNPQSVYTSACLTLFPLFSLFQLSYIAEDENGKIVGYVLAKMWVSVTFTWHHLKKVNVQCVSINSLELSLGRRTQMMSPMVTSHPWLVWLRNTSFCITDLFGWLL